MERMSMISIAKIEEEKRANMVGIEKSIYG